MSSSELSRTQSRASHNPNRSRARVLENISLLWAIFSFLDNTPFQQKKAEILRQIAENKLSIRELFPKKSPYYLTPTQENLDRLRLNIPKSPAYFIPVLSKEHYAKFFSFPTLKKNATQIRRDIFEYKRYLGNSFEKSPDFWFYLKRKYKEERTTRTEEALRLTEIREYLELSISMSLLSAIVGAFMTLLLASTGVTTEELCMIGSAFGAVSFMTGCIAPAWILCNYPSQDSEEYKIFQAIRRLQEEKSPEIFMPSTAIIGAAPPRENPRAAFATYGSYGSHGSHGSHGASESTRIITSPLLKRAQTAGIGSGGAGAPNMPRDDEGSGLDLV
jgi:hypothetical protein